MLKEFIKEQKREMRALRSNKLFQEFMQKAKADPAKKLKQEGEATKTPDEPGHALVATLDLIRNTAEKQKRKMHGVWSAFGQPYAPLGVPEVVREISVDLAPNDFFVSHVHVHIGDDVQW